MVQYYPQYYGNFAENKREMKRILLTVLLCLLTVQTAGSQNLVCKTVFDNGNVSRCTVYKWMYGVLLRKIELDNGLGYEYQTTIVTTYDTVPCDGRTDTIEYRTTFNMAHENVSKEMDRKSYHENGTLAMIRYFDWEEGQWKEDGYKKYNSLGQVLEQESYGKYHYVYPYDPSGRYTGKDEFYFTGITTHIKESVDFSDDGLHAIWIKSCCNAQDSTWKNMDKIIYEYDADGRVLSSVGAAPDGDESRYSSFTKNVYRYDRKGRKKSEMLIIQYVDDDIDDEVLEQYKFKYRHEHQTAVKAKNGRSLFYNSVTRTKYDWRHNVPLKEFHIDGTKSDKRHVTKAWSYEWM